MTPIDLAARMMAWLPPETAHNAALSLLELGFGAFTPSPSIHGQAVTLKRSGLRLSNPVGLAAGFDKDARVYAPMLRLGFGFVECGTVTPRPQAGNPRPRLFRLREDRAVINRMGFNNGGLDAFVERLKRASGAAGVVGANIGANKDSDDRAADYVTGLRAVWAHAAYVTVNVSSPNTPGLRGLQERPALEALLARLAEARGDLAARQGARPMFLKVAPDLDERAIDELCEAALASGAVDGLIVSNTTIERPEGLVSRRRSETGGLSGRPLMARSTAVLRAFADRVGDRLDLIGAGGVASAADVREKLKAGAQAVQLYSAMVFEGPGLVGRILKDLAASPEAS